MRNVASSNNGPALAVMGAEEAVAVLMPILTHLMRERGYRTAEWRGP